MKWADIAQIGIWCESLYGTETLDGSLFTQYHTIFHSGRMLVYSVLVLGNTAGSSLMYRVRVSQRKTLISTHVLGGSHPCAK